MTTCALFTTATTLYCSAQQSDTAQCWSWVVEPIYDIITPFSDDLSAVQVDELWGFVDRLGKVVLEPQFDQVGNLRNDGRERPSCWVRFCESGKNVHLGQKHDLETRLIRSEFLIAVVKDKRIGFIDTTGRMIIEPRYYRVSNLGDFDLISTIDDNCKEGLIDHHGNILFEPTFDRISGIDREFISTRLDGRYGLLTSKGEVVAVPIYDSIKSYDDLQVRAYLNDSLIYVNRSGKCSNCPTQNDLPKRVEIFTQNGRYGMVDTNKNIVIEAQYEMIWDVDDGVFVLLKNGRFSIADRNGRFISKSEYSEINGIEDGFYEVKANSKIGIIHPAKGIVFEPLCDELYEISKDMILSGKIGRNSVKISIDGQITIESELDAQNNPKDDDEPFYVDGYAIVDEDQIIDMQGNVLFDARDNDVDQLNHCGGNGYFSVLRMHHYQIEVDGEPCNAMRSLYGVIKINKAQ